MTHLVTGYAGYEHIKSEDDGAFNAAFFGGGQYVMECGNQFEGSIINNNTVRILDGDLLMYGRHARINPNTYEDMTITTGTAGTNRIDLICMTYEKNENDGTEQAYLNVIKGTETPGTPDIPEYTDGNILEGATLNNMPLYKVVIQGVVLQDIIPLFDVIPTYKTLAERYAAQFQKACNTYLGALNVLDTMEEIEANTLPNQLAGALAIKSGFADVNSSLVNVTACTPLAVWGVINNSFRVHGNTCHFNYEFTNGLNPAPSETIFGKNAPFPKTAQRIPCIVISADTLTYRSAVLYIEENGDIKFYGGSVEFQGLVIANGSYEIA